MGNDTTSGLGNLGMQAAGGVINTGLGMILGGYNDRRQLRQQKRLQELQMKGSKEMTDYNFMKEFEMWKATNYGAQMEEIKGAGLNPALLYGMKGGGGVTTGHGEATVQGAQAPTGGREIETLTGMGLQMQMNQAQIELMKAQAKKTNVEATKIEGVDTGLAATQIESIKQGITNARAQEALTRVQTTIAGLEATLKGESLEDQIWLIAHTARKAMNEVREAEANADVAEWSKDDRAAIIKAELAGIGIKNALAEKQIQLTEEQLTKIKADIAQGWKGLQLTDDKIAIDRFKAAMEAARPGVLNLVGGELNRIIEGIWKATGQDRPQYKIPKK